MFETYTYRDPSVVPQAIQDRWEFIETSSAAAVLKAVCPEEWSDIINVLSDFSLDPLYWLKKGGNRGDIAQQLDGMFQDRGWKERRVDLVTHGLLISKDLKTVEQLPEVRQEGYLVDNFKGRVALDVEWNAKDGNLDRDMSAYRSWHEAGVISAAVLITQNRVKLKTLAHQLWDEYQATLDAEERNAKLPIDLGTSTTTNLEKAAIRVRRGIMGTCPLLIVAASDITWNGQPYLIP